MLFRGVANQVSFYKVGTAGDVVTTRVTHKLTERGYTTTVEDETPTSD